MIGAIIISISTVIGLLIFLKISSQNKIIDTVQLIKIEKYISKKMNFEDIVLFLNTVRSFAMDLVQKSQQQKLPKPLKSLTHELLGLILKIPRMSEQDDSNDLAKAFKQIETITEVSKEIKKFFTKNLPTLKKHSK